MQLKELESKVSNIEEVITGLNTIQDLEQLIWNFEHPDLDFNPVGLTEFVCSDNYLDCGEEIFACCKKDLESIEKGGQKIIILEGAPGCGKSFTSSCIFAYSIYRMLCLRNPQKTFGLARGTLMCAMNMGVNELNAKNVIFNEIKARIDNSPFYQKYFRPDDDVKSMMNFDKKISLIPGNSKMSFPLGFNVFCAAMDDCAWYQDTDLLDIGKEMFNALDKRISRRYPTCDWAYLLMVSNPSYNAKWIERMQERALENPEKIWAMRRTIWEAKPWIYCGETFEYEGRAIPIEHKDDYEKDPVTAERDLESKPSAALMPFFKSLIPVYQSLNKSIKNPVEGKFFNIISPDFKPYSDSNYFMHLDLAKNKCSAAFALSRWVSTNKIRVDLIMRFDPKVLGGEINFEDVREYIYLLKEMGFNIRKITLDGFQSVDTIQILKRKGFTADNLSLDRSDVPYETFKSKVLEGIVEFPWVDIEDTRVFETPRSPEEWFMRECKTLEKAGNKITKPAKGTKDVIDAVCLSGDTKISLLNGDEVAIKELVGKEFYVYSCLPNGKIVFGKANNVRKIGNKKVIKLTFDNGESLICTPEHKIMMRSGKYINADKLCVGESLMPLYRDVSKNKNGLNGYEIYKDNIDSKNKYTHQEVAKQVLNFSYKNNIHNRQVIHHKDINKRNNSPDNFIIMDWHKHRKLHCKLASENLKRMWKDPVFRKECLSRISKIGKKNKGKSFIKYNKSKERIEKLKANGLFKRNGLMVMNKFWEDENFRKNHKKRLTGENNYQFRKDISFHNIIAGFRNGIKEKLDMYKYLKCGWRTFERIIKNKGYKNWREVKSNYNHKISKIEILNEKVDVYDMTVDKYHNFSIASGIFVHNCGSVYNAIEVGNKKARKLTAKIV